MLSTIKGSLSLFLFLLTIMKETSKGVDGRTVKDLETPQLNCFGQNGSLWWRRNPLPSKGVAGTEAPRPRQVGYRTSSTPQFLTGLASGHTVRSNSQHFRATCLRPQTVRCTKKSMQGLESRDATLRAQVEWTTQLLTSPKATTNRNTKRNRHQRPSSETVEVLADQSRGMTLAVRP